MKDLAGRKIVNLVREGRVKMTGEDIQEKVFDEYSSLEELNKELEKIDEQEEVMVKGWSTDDRAFNATLARGLEKLACMLRRAMK